ncbi:Arhgap27 [Symbiodinium sp. CCMP2592]|nr:Arhgap27 [Symbiodinium sp. CCMP2592]
MAWHSSGWDSSWSGWDWSSYGQGATWGGTGGHSGSAATAPVATAAVAPAPAASGKGSGKGKKGAATSGGKGGHSGAATAPVAAAAGPASSASSGLAPNWEQVTDAGTGMPYYWNPVTGETSWQAPQEAARGRSWKDRKRGLKGEAKKAENRRKSGLASKIIRDKVTRKFIDRLAQKDTVIGNLQALQATSVVMGQVREQERDKAQGERDELEQKLRKMESALVKSQMELEMSQKIGAVHATRIEDLEKDKALLQDTLKEQSRSQTTQAAEVEELKKDLERHRGRRLEQQGLAEKILADQLAAEKASTALAKAPTSYTAHQGACSAKADLLSYKKQHEAERKIWKKERSKDAMLQIDLMTNDYEKQKAGQQALNRGLDSQLKDARDELASLKKAGSCLGFLGVAGACTLN